ncbi:hypothetical protein AB4Z22_29495, partial [Paenibacillus sp. TAF58]
MGRGKFLSKIKWPYSLRNRLFIILPLTALLPLVLIGGISYYSIHTILENRTETSVRNHLHEVRLSLDNTLSQMNHVSQQLAYNSRISKMLDEYWEGNTYIKKSLHDQIFEELSMVGFTNPNVGLMFYFSSESRERYFENYSSDRSVDILSLPLMMKTNQMAYFGPHKSLNPLDGHLVFSVVRKVGLQNKDNIYVYMETNYKWAESILQSQNGNNTYIHLIVDDNGEIAYSEKPDVFPVRGIFPKINERRIETKGYYAFDEYSNQSWRVVTLIPISTYKYEIDRWMQLFVIVAIFSIMVSCLFAVLIWRTIYRPLGNLVLDIRDVKNQKLLAPARRSNNLEFDIIHGEFENMRVRIVSLIDEIEQKEKQKSELEVEKLMN